MPQYYTDTLPRFPSKLQSNVVSSNPSCAVGVIEDRTILLHPGKSIAVATKPNTDVASLFLNMPSRLFGVDRRSPTHVDRTRTSKNSSRTSVSELAMPQYRTSAPAMDHGKRQSIVGKAMNLGDKKDRSVSKDKNAKDQRSPPEQPPVKLEMIMESPPAVFIGSPSQSTGALISGRLQLTANVPEATLDKITMYLECTTTTKRPVQDRCRECLANVVDLFEWNFLTKPKTLKAADGKQEMPFSHLIPGHLPTTTQGHIGAIDYSLHIRAKTNDGREIEYRRELIMKRAILPGTEKNSMRIFPPTDLTLSVTLPNIVHPIGEIPVQCRMTGLITKRGEQQFRWRLRKLTWRIEQNETMISPACSKHAAKVGGEGKGVQHEHTRELGWEELKQGWKTDYDEGQIEGEFMVAMNANLNPQCDVEAPNGLKITHNLVIELVIAEEWAPSKKLTSATPTGAARVLRTQFQLSVTERAGMGLSWDDEMPPMYEDVPDSPPHYPNEPTPDSPPHYQNELTSMVEYEGPDLHEDVEQLNLNG